MELRPNTNLDAGSGGSHLYLVDGSGVRHLDCSATACPFGRQLVDDVLQRTETAMSGSQLFPRVRMRDPGPSAGRAGEERRGRSAHNTNRPLA